MLIREVDGILVRRVGDFNHPVFLLRDPKRVSLGVGEIHTRGRWGCPRCSCCVRVIEGILDSWIWSCTGGLVMRTSGAAPVVVECASSGVIAGAIPVKDTPTSCGVAPGLDDDFPISGDDDASSPDEDAPVPVDDAPAVVDDISSSRRLFS